MSNRYSSPLRSVVCSRCGAKIIIREVSTSHPEALPKLFDVFSHSFVCFKCLNKEDKRI